MKKDPLRSAQVSALLELYRASSKHKILFVNHHFGGGCEKHIQELGTFFQDKIEVVTIRSSELGGVIFRMGIDRRGESLRFYLPEDYGALLELCRYLKISRVHFHHVTGIHPIIRNLARDLGIAYDITLHDYYFINSNPTLTDRYGRYCKDKDMRDLLCAKAQPIAGRLSAKQWREDQVSFLKAAERVFIPSVYAAKLYLDYFPDLKPIVARHPDWEKDAPYPGPRLPGLTENLPVRIGVLGGLNAEKGADLLECCAKISVKRSLPLEFHLIGFTSRPLNPSIRVYGWYEDKKLGTIISEINPHLVWFPAQWPETYSYTLSAALKWGGPVIVPDIGAFQERVKGRPLTWVKPWDMPISKWLELFLSIRDQMILLGDREISLEWKDQLEDKIDFSYVSDYVIKSPEPQSQDIYAFVPSTDWLCCFMECNNRSVKETILLYLLRIMPNPFIKKSLSIIPYYQRRRIKRFFSMKTIHEIMREACQDDKK